MVALTHSLLTSPSPTPTLLSQRIIPRAPSVMDVNNTIVSPLPDSQTQSNRHSKKKSIVWEHFTLETLSPGCIKAHCKHSGRSLAYITDSKQVGTSHLKRHISSAICQENQQIPYSKNAALGGDGAAYPPKKQARERAAPRVAARISFDQECCNNNIAKMIILHDYPLHLVEHQGFIDFVQTLQPQFNLPSFNAVEGECVAMYLREKQNLLKLINGIPGRLNLTLDLWTSNQTLAYVFIRGHFIDGDWNLHHPILNVMMVPFPDSYDSLNRAIRSCLNDWYLEGRLFTLAFDKFFSNETVIGNLMSHLSFKNPVLLNGQLLSQNCYARMLSRLALDALSAMRETVDKVRESVKYVKSSEYHEHEFSCAEGTPSSPWYDGPLIAAENGVSDIGCYISDFIDNQQFNSELNEYLEEPLEPSVQEFDILGWWRVKGLKYPTFSRMASDILSMPVS